MMRTALDDQIEATRYGRLLTAVVVTMPVIVWAVALWLFHAHRGTFMALTIEDGMVETAQVGLVLVGAVLSATVCLLLARAGERKWAMAYALGFAFLIWVAGEEVSWGQRFAGLATPRWFADRNLQGEMNFHNLPNVMPVIGAMMTAVMVLGIFGGLTVWRRSAAELDDWRAYLWVPQPPLTVAWLSLVGYFVYVTLLRRAEGGVSTLAVLRLQEVAELVVILAGLAFLMAAVRGARVLHGRLNQRRARTSEPAFLYAVTVGRATRPSGAHDSRHSAGQRRPLRVPLTILLLSFLAGVAGWTFGTPASLPEAEATVQSPKTVPSSGGPVQFVGDWMLVTRDGSIARLAQSTAGSGVSIEISRSATKVAGDVQLARPGVRIGAGTPYRLEFRARAARARSVFVAVTQNHAPWDDLGLYVPVNLSPTWTDVQLAFVGTEDDPRARVIFDLGGGPSVEVADLVLRRGPDWAAVPLEARIPVP